MLPDEGSGCERTEAQRDGQVVKFDEGILIVAVAVSDGHYRGDGGTRLHLYPPEPPYCLGSHPAGIYRGSEHYGLSGPDSYRGVRAVEGQVDGPYAGCVHTGCHSLRYCP